MKLQIALIVILSSFLFACGSQTTIHPIDKYLTDKIKVDKNNVPSDSNQYYFPLEIFKDTSIYKGYDTFIDKWYSGQLFAMREPLLFNKRIEKEIYRFTWLRTFHNPVAIRIEKEGDTYMLYWKVCDGAGGYSPGKLIIDKQIIIDRTQWDTFQNLQKKCNFWNMKTNERIMGEDGAEWIMEGVDSKNYHVAVRWSPNGGAYFNCCSYLISLIDLKIKKEDKY